MKNDKLLVREAHIRRGCLSFACDPDVEPTLVCPLCVMDGKRHSCDRTAAYSRSGHILCLSNTGGCGRYSAILLRTSRQEEVPVIPVAFLRDPRTLETQTVAIKRLRPALEGSGDLLELLSMDTVQPEVVVGFVLPKILIGGHVSGGTFPGSSRAAHALPFDNSALADSIPPAIARLLHGHHRTAVGAL